MTVSQAGNAGNRGGLLAERVAWVGIVGTAFFILAVAALHFLRPDYNPVARFISEFAVGPYSWLMTIAFFALALASFAVAFGIHKTLSPSWKGRIGTSLLGIFGACILLAGIFRTDLQGTPLTTSGAIHAGVSISAFLIVQIAIFVNSWAFARDARWKPYGRISAALGVALVVAFIGFLVSFGSGWLGVGQRIFVAVFLLWLLLTATRLRSIASASREPSKGPLPTV